MNIGFIGLGKLGLPCALAIENKGHKVYGIDSNVKIKKVLENKLYPYKEKDIDLLLKSTDLQLCTDYETLLLNTEMIFIAVQTPHDLQYEGITRIPEQMKDFDYSFLIKALDSISNAFQNLSLQEREERKGFPLVVISTVSPGTYQNILKDHVYKDFNYIYNPFFIAMGTTIDDFLNSEFILLGTKNKENLKKVQEFYSSINSQVPQKIMSITSAELTKVAYNTYITSKIVFSNTLMEICDKFSDANVDDVIETLKLANKRLISTSYMDAGGGDGGSCHPRDNIALSWLAEEINLNYNLFLSLMLARERQTEFLVNLIVTELQNFSPQQVMILGKSFKPETNITTGSFSVLLFNILKEYIDENVIVNIVDPYIDREEYNNALIDTTPKVFFIGTKHPEFNEIIFPNNSVIIDPWGYIVDKPNCVVKRVGRRK